METTTINNTTEFAGQEIKVNKSDFEIYQHDLSFEPYYSIALKDSQGDNIVFGGDSADEDCYNKQLVQSVFDEWDGTLKYYSNYGYCIEL